MSTKVYEIITEQVIELLEKGEVPWSQPWVGGYPKNLVSGKEYRGINTFLLQCTKYASPYWLSYKQCLDIEGYVRQGEKSTMVIFWKQLSLKSAEVESEEVTEKIIPFLRYYRVFNVEQCEGLENKLPENGKGKEFQPIEQCENTVYGMQNKPPIVSEEQRAYYSPLRDIVNMPRKESFESEEFYYSVLFHELGHSTGHESRLARRTVTENANFGSEKYSREELVAEMTAAFLCGHCEIDKQTIENSAAYIQNWLKVLKNDVKLVVLAAAQAQRAADYILCR